MPVDTVLKRRGERAVVVKSVPLVRADELRAEAERLRCAAHPGVVEVVASAPAGDRWELLTAHAGRSLAAVGTLPPARAAAVLAALASTVADLHRLGITHGRIDASHVLLGAQDRPVLCGFGAGAAAATPETDVAALGRLLSDVLGSEEVDEPVAERWWGRSRQSSGHRRALLVLADRACAEPPTRRPTAERLAAAIAAAVPEVRAEGSSAATPSEASPRHRVAGQLDAPSPLTQSTTTARRALVVVGVIAVTVTAWVVLTSPSKDRDRSEAQGVVARPASNSSSVADAAPRRLGTALPRGVVEHDGVRYRVGRDGDEVLVDDWDCDGDETAAILRPGTGEVFVFPRWAGDERIEVQPVATVAEAEALVSERAAEGCPSLAVRVDGGRLVTVVDGADR